MNVVRDLILIVVKVKERIKRSQRFPFNSSDVSAMSVLSEEKQRRERSQRFHFKSSESENTVWSVVRYFILVVVKWNSVVIEVRDFLLIVLN